jgi:hypothetical protein
MNNNVNNEDYSDEHEDLIRQLKYTSYSIGEEIYNNSYPTLDISYEDVSEVKDIDDPNENNSDTTNKAEETTIIASESEDDDNDFANFDDDEANYMEEN